MKFLNELIEKRAEGIINTKMEQVREVILRETTSTTALPEPEEDDIASARKKLSEEEEIVDIEAEIEEFST